MDILIQRLQELWQRLFKKNNSSNDVTMETYTNFDRFAKYVTGETRENALKVSTLSVNANNAVAVNLDIPTAIGCFSHLTMLQVKGCNLTSLPWSIIYLKKLITLDISNNRLQVLPSFIGSLSSLKTLNVEDNLLLVLPTALLKLSNLKELLLIGNERLQSPDYAVCKQGLKVILKTISQRQVVVNAWAGCKVAGTFQPFHGTEVPTLFALAASTITTSSVDFLSVMHVPPRLKTFLLEEKKFEITVAKCSACRGFFSNSMMLEAHQCKVRRS